MNPQQFKEIKPFSDFYGLQNPDNFFSLPGDWHVVLVDIKNSTQAIKEGRYRDVNTIGAAAIVTVRNVVPEDELPFVFGGDGATFIIPPQYHQKAMEGLVNLQHLATQKFNFELRVGTISLQQLQTECPDVRVQVGRYQLSPHKTIAMFRGQGLAAAENLMKENSEKYAPKLNESSCSEQPNLSNLSCRWDSIPAKRGRAISLLVSFRRKDPGDISNFLELLNVIFPEGLDAYNPVNTAHMNYRSFTGSLKAEAKLHSSCWSFRFFARAVEIAVAVAIFKWRLPAVFFNRGRYEKSMELNTDFKKFDDLFRATLDCHPNQVEALKGALESARLEGIVYYGIFETNRTLMTCFVEGVNSGQHIHFVDADQGGYAVAALQLKEQMKDGKREALEQASA